MSGQQSLQKWWRGRSGQWSSRRRRDRGREGGRKGRREGGREGRREIYAPKNDLDQDQQRRREGMEGGKEGREEVIA